MQTLGSPSTAAPIVVGGLGGSATRVFARLLQLSGHDIGSDLNRSLDHLGFTLLFKGRGDLESQLDWGPAALRLIERGAWTGGAPSPEERAALGAALRRVLVHGHDHEGNGRGAWALRRAWRLLRAKPPTGAGPDSWGLKEPNAHLFLPALAAHFPRLRFVFVMRHGLDMALSRNLYQLHRFGPALGVQTPSPGDDPAGAQLRYWVASAERAHALGRELLGDRFLCVRYDELTARPGEVLERLSDFLGIDAGRFESPERATLTAPSSSSGRWRTRGRAAFPADLVEAVASWGFEV
jgi:hypothetical protein